MLYRFELGRNASYYILNLVIPSILITIVTLVGFFMPYSSTGETTEKVHTVYRITSVNSPWGELFFVTPN